MRKFIYLIIIILFGIGLAYAIPKRDDVKPNEIVDNDSGNPDHFNSEYHNTLYDHDAFLGSDQAKEFEQYSPEESKRRLGMIVDRIDEDNDGFVTLSELKKWIQYTQRRYRDEDVNRNWNQHDTGDNNAIDWKAYRKAVYGFMDDMDRSEVHNEDNGISYSSMLMRDRRRWAAADKDSDDRLTKEEFAVFLHPEDNPTMSEVVLTESIEDLDKDKDGKISVDEYIGDMYTASEPDEEEPEWVTSERESFAKFRDVDGDGFLNREEVRDWIVPKDFDHAESEAKHLVFEADEDSDEKLTKKEILKKYDLFVGSQATDFGEALGRHDEF